MESQLLAAGWRKLSHYLYAHDVHGELYRSDRNGRWYRRVRGAADVLMGRTLAEAITKALALPARLF
jgi:hypothetical protein